MLPSNACHTIILFMYQTPKNAHRPLHQLNRAEEAHEKELGDELHM